MGKKAPVTVKSFRKIVRKVKSGLPAEEELPERTITAKRERPRPVGSPPGEKTWKITRNFLFLFSRNPENGRWRLTLEARPAVMIKTALTFAAVLVLIFGANLISKLSRTGDERVSETRPTEVAKPPAGEEKAWPTKPVKDGRSSQVEKQKIYLKSEPHWADVWFRDEVVGRTPIHKLKLPVGKQTLFLENQERGISKKVSFEVDNDRFMRVTVYIKKKAGEDLKVEHMEDGAWIQVLPAPVKGSTKTSNGARKKVYPEKVQKPSPVSKKPTAKPKPKKIEYVDVKLNVVPWGYVYIDGIKQKKGTPLLDLKLKAGKHKVRFVNPYLKLEKTIEFTAEKGRKMRVIAFFPGYEREPGKDMIIYYDN